MEGVLITMDSLESTVRQSVSTERDVQGRTVRCRDQGSCGKKLPLQVKDVTCTGSCVTTPDGNTVIQTLV